MIARAIDMAFATLLGLDAVQPAAHLPRRLVALFADLARPAPAPDTEALIWALWTHHPDTSLDAAMGEALTALAARRHATARAILDHLVAAAPDWSEAWNKRATLAFIENRDVDSIADILRCLALEPRHFGALAGLGAICARQDRPHEALLAHDLALARHPHLAGVAEAAAALRRVVRARLN